MNFDRSNSLQLPSIIINADDFGLSPSVNKAIIDAYKTGLISSTTMITNMSGFKEACEISVAYNLTDCIGIHLNLMDGQPLTRPIRRCSRFCNADGFFSGFLEGQHFNLSSMEATAVIEELTAQIEMCEQHGIKPTHIDSHHHFHTSSAFLLIIIKLARIKGIPAIRLNNNCFESLQFHKKVYKILYNTMLYLAGMAKSEYFCTIDDVEKIIPKLKDCIVEVMVHPTYSEDNTLIDAENRKPLVTQLRSIERYPKLSYAKLRRSKLPKLLNIGV